MRASTVHPSTIVRMRPMLLGLLALLLLAVPAGAVVQSYTSSPSAFIADGNPGATATDTIIVPDSGTINDVNVILTVQHPQTADVVIELVGPTGVRVRLFDRELGVGDGFTDMMIDDEAAGPPPGFTVNGTCQVSNSFQADGLLSDFDGLEVNGAWTIEVSDHAASDAVDCDCDGFVVGPACPRVLAEWTLVVDFNASAMDTDGDGVLDGDDNCVKIPNVDQEDKDWDGRGCVCDRDEKCCPVSISVLCPCWGPGGTRRPWRQPREYYLCVEEKVETFVEWGVLGHKQAKWLLERAKKSNCGLRLKSAS